MNPYITKTFDKLVEIYCDEHSRINQEDKATTQKLIKQELMDRFEGMIRMLDYPELADHPERIAQYFTHEYNR